MLAKGIVSGSLLRCNITRVATAAASGINHSEPFELTKLRQTPEALRL
jgi:hypothetical protein